MIYLPVGPGSRVCANIAVRDLHGRRCRADGAVAATRMTGGNWPRELVQRVVAGC